MKTAVIIQARNSATRLPGKVLMLILKKTILEYVVERVKKADGIDGVIVATTDKKADDSIEELTKKINVPVYRGSEDDVLDRFYQTAKEHSVEHIIRITADCPLIDPGVIERVLRQYFEDDCDYCSNVLEETFPDGEDVEVFGFQALSNAWEHASLKSEREHVTPYIRNNPGKFSLLSIKNDVDLSKQRWTLDQKEDFIFLKEIIETLYPLNPNFNMEDVLELLRNDPRIGKVNDKIERNEGYHKSLSRDETFKRSER